MSAAMTDVAMTCVTVCDVDQRLQLTRVTSQQSRVSAGSDVRVGNVGHVPQTS